MSTAGGLCAAKDEAANERISRQLEEIRSRLDVVEKNQQTILEKEDKILEEVNRVRIWVHRK